VKDFQRKKMAFRVTMAKEMFRRGMSKDEIIASCKPTEEDHRLLREEIEAELVERDDVIEADWVEINPAKETHHLVNPYLAWTIAAVMSLLAADALLRIFGI